jgi:hypothetical protein
MPHSTKLSAALYCIGAKEGCNCSSVLLWRCHPAITASPKAAVAPPAIIATSCKISQLTGSRLDNGLEVALIIGDGIDHLLVWQLLAHK